MPEPKTDHEGASITIGRYLDALDDSVSVICDGDSDDADLARHVGKPWMRAYLREKYHLEHLVPDASTPPTYRSDSATVSDDALSHHTFLCGSTGSGKTRLLLHLVAQQMASGYSAVVMDTKRETLWRVLAAAKQRGIPPENILLLLPGEDGNGCPVWNPLLPEEESGSLSASVAAFVSILAAAFDSWGPRTHDILTNAALLVAAHGLSLYELVRFLQIDTYRAALARLPLPDASLRKAADRIAVSEAWTYFTREFSTWGRGEQNTAVSPVLNKLRGLVNMPFLRALFCGRNEKNGGTTKDLRLSQLWQGKRLLLVHLDEHTLGQEGARLLAGIFLKKLFGAAVQNGAKPGSKPVVLALDELGLSERMTGGAVTDILAAAREYRLRLMAACQHLSQLSPPLRDALLTNTALRVFFRLGDADAKIAAATLAAGCGNRLRRLVIDSAPAKAGGTAPTATWSHPILDGRGLYLERTGGNRDIVPVSERLLGEDILYLPESVRRLRSLAVRSGLNRLYVRDAWTWEPVEVGSYARGLRDADVSLPAVTPLCLSVTFPRPRVRREEYTSESDLAQRYAGTLLSLPKRRALLWTSDDNDSREAARIVEVVPVPDPPDPASTEAFALRVLAASGATAESLWSTEEWRRERVEETTESREVEEPNGRVPKGENSDPKSEPPAVKKTAFKTGEVTEPSPALHLPLAGERADDGSIA